MCWIITGEMPLRFAGFSHINVYWSYINSALLHYHTPLYCIYLKKFRFQLFVYRLKKYYESAGKNCDTKR